MLFDTSEDQSREEETATADTQDTESQKDLELAEREQHLPLEIQEKRNRGALRTGFTTGTSATAATKAALIALAIAEDRERGFGVFAQGKNNEHQDRMDRHYKQTIFGYREQSSKMREMILMSQTEQRFAQLFFLLTRSESFRLMEGMASVG